MLVVRAHKDASLTGQCQSEEHRFWGSGMRNVVATRLLVPHLLSRAP